MAYPDQAAYALAAGFNNIGSLQVIAGYNPGTLRHPFEQFIGFGFYNPGTIRQLVGVNYLSGYPSCQWLFNYIDYDQYLWLNTTYCNGLYSGFVTAKVTEKDQLTTVNWNAKLVLPSDVTMKAFRPGWDSVPLTFFKHGVAA